MDRSVHWILLDMPHELLSPVTAEAEWGGTRDFAISAPNAPTSTIQAFSGDFDARL
jgi:hypothetical protein